MCSDEISLRLIAASILTSGAFAGKWEMPRMAAKESRAFVASDISMPCRIGPVVSNRDEEPVSKNILVVLDRICNRRDDTRFRGDDHSLERDHAGRLVCLSTP